MWNNLTMVLTLDRELIDLLDTQFSDLPKRFVVSPEVRKDIAYRSIDSALNSKVAKKILVRAEQNRTYQERLGQLGEAPFRTKLNLLVETFPLSLYRDEQIDELLNNEFTTWEDIEIAESFMTVRSSVPHETEREITTLRSAAGMIPVLFHRLFPRDGSLNPVLQRKETEVQAFLKGETVIEDNGQDKDIHALLGEVDELTADERIALLANNLTDEELLLLLDDFCLGENGLMIDTNFEKYGQVYISLVFSYIETKIQNDAFKNNRSVLECALYLGLKELTPQRRTEILLLFIKSIRFYQESELLIEHAFVDILCQFIFGTKLLQMDSLLPANIVQLAKHAKEDGKPESKRYVKALLVNSGRAKQFKGISPIVSVASTASVYFLEKNEVDGVKAKEEDGATTHTYDRAIKVLKTSIESRYQEELRAFKVAVIYLAKEMNHKCR
jgi:hypothetical protein